MHGIAKETNLHSPSGPPRDPEGPPDNNAVIEVCGQLIKQLFGPEKRITLI